MEPAAGVLSAHKFMEARIGFTTAKARVRNVSS